jgi:hypothetical protein
MTEEERWQLILATDDEYLKGGVVLSEWCAFITREADTAFAKGAFLASILTATAAIETYLKSEYGSSDEKWHILSSLIDGSDLEESHKVDLHKLRKYRNSWVHIKTPWNDLPILDHPEEYERELEQMALFAVSLLRRTIFAPGSQFI